LFEQGWLLDFLPHELTPPIPQVNGDRHSLSSVQAE
jgi:hypothetical protein